MSAYRIRRAITLAGNIIVAAGLKLAAASDYNSNSFATPAGPDKQRRVRLVQCAGRQAAPTRDHRSRRIWDRRHGEIRAR